MANSYRQQVERIDRPMTIVEADNPHEIALGLLTIDVIMFTCQSMWHLKDWILNDSDFGAKDNKELKAVIQSSHCLRVSRSRCLGGIRASFRQLDSAVATETPQPPKAPPVFLDTD